MRSMKLAAVAALAGTVLLAGCGKKADVSMKNASAETVANTAQKEAKLQPGQWEISFSMGGAPQGNKMSTCITPEQAAKPAGDLFAGKNSGADCTFENFTMSDGKINATMTCKMKGMPGQTKTVMSGTYSPTEFTNDSTMTISGMPNMKDSTMHVTSSGKRVGECTASPTKAS